MFLRVLKEFVNQELDHRIGMLVGYLVGGIAVLCSIFYLMMVGGYIVTFLEMSNPARFGSALMLLMVGLFIFGLFKIAIWLNKSGEVP